MLRTGRNRVIAAGDRRLRRAIQVREGRVRQPRHPIPQGRGGEDLSTPQEPPQSGKVIELHDIELGHVTEQRRYREPLRELRAPDELGERIGIQVDLRVYEVLVATVPYQ